MKARVNYSWTTKEQNTQHRDDDDLNFDPKLSSVSTGKDAKEVGKVQLTSYIKTESFDSVFAFSR